MEPDWMLKHLPWIFLVVGTTLQGFVGYQQVKRRIAANPELERGYRTLRRGWIFWVNLPWIYMGLGIISGQTVWFPDYLMILHGPNAFVLSWWLLLAVLFILGTYWMLFRGGAEMLERHPGSLIFPAHWKAPVLRKYWCGIVAWNTCFALICFSGIFRKFGIPVAPSGNAMQSPDNNPTASNSDPASFVFVLFPILFIAAWLFVSFLLSVAGGWTALARLYPNPPHFSGKKFGFRSGSLGMAHIGGGLMFISNRDGLRISMLFPYRFWHPPFCVPWEEISVAEEQFLFFRSTRFTFQKAPEIQLVISSRLARKILDAAKQE